MLPNVVLLSVVTWTLAWLKIRQNQKAVSDMKNFEQQFFKLRDWSQLKALLQTAQGPLASMAAAGVEAGPDPSPKVLPCAFFVGKATSTTLTC